MSNFIENKVMGFIIFLVIAILSFLITMAVGSTNGQIDANEDFVKEAMVRGYVSTIESVEGYRFQAWNIDNVIQEKAENVNQTR